MLNRFPPYSGTRLSATVTRAPSSTRRRAKAEPMNPKPPVIRIRCREKISAFMRRSAYRSQDVLFQAPILIENWPPTNTTVRDFQRIENPRKGWEIENERLKIAPHSRVPKLCLGTRE